MPIRTSQRAMTPAQRMMRMRERALTAIAECQGLDQVPDTGLLEGLRVAYRAGDVADVAKIAAELVKRANPRARGGRRVDLQWSVSSVSETGEQ